MICAHLGKNANTLPRYDVIAGDFNLPPGDEFPSDERVRSRSLGTTRRNTEYKGIFASVGKEYN